MALTRAGLWAGTTAAIALFVLAVAAFVLVEYLLFTALVFLVLSILLSYLATGSALLIVSATVALFPVGYHVYRVFAPEFAGNAVVVRAFRDVFADPERVAGDDPDRARLLETVDRLADRADVHSPAVFVLETSVPITATVGYRRSTASLLVSRGVYERLDGRELEAVLAHELAHLRNRDATVMTLLASPWANARVYHRHDSSIALFTGVPSVVARFCTTVVGHAREYAADDRAVELTDDPAALTSALEALEADLESDGAEVLRAHPVLAAFSLLPPPDEDRHRFDPAWYHVRRRFLGTHPSTERRLERLREHAFWIGRGERDGHERDDLRDGLPVKKETEREDESRSGRESEERRDDLPVRRDSRGAEGRASGLPDRSGDRDSEERGEDLPARR